MIRTSLTKDILENIGIFENIPTLENIPTTGKVPWKHNYQKYPNIGTYVFYGNEGT